MTAREPRPEPVYTEDFSEVEAAERQWIQARRRACGQDVAEDAPITALALSGGGIRSATFNLGVLQALARAGLLHQVDYLSSVSGGGYIAACLSWLRAHFPVCQQRDIAAAPLANGRGTVLDWLRAHGNYLINGKGISGWTLGASILAGTLLNLLVLMPLLLGLVALASAEWWSVSWPVWLHLPGAQAISGHDGFILLLLTGLASAGLYLLVLLVFALASSERGPAGHSTERRLRLVLGWCLATTVMGLVVGLLPVVADLEMAALSRFGSERLAGVMHHLTYLGPMATGLWSLRLARKQGGGLAVAGLGLLLYGFLTLLYYLCTDTGLIGSSLYIGWLGLSLVLALVGNINTLSMHSFYRGRLADAYLPVVANPGSETADWPKDPLRFRLTELHPSSGAPLHLINTTLNTRNSRRQRLQSRGGASMVLSPLYCGSAATGYRHTGDYLGGAMTLSTAFAVSGAAVDPDTFSTRSRPLSFLMTLLNLRLGVWTRNPRSIRQWRWLPGWYRYMLREMLGLGLAETEAEIHLSDGGHFDNLGLYELVRRRCRFIVISDAGADPDTSLSDLGRAIQRVRADFDAEVMLSADELVRRTADGMAERADVWGRVRYADGSEGQILYLRAALCPGLSVDIYAYWRRNPSFPNQTTADQFFDEMQFDSYRQLGLELMTAILAGAPRDFATLFGRAEHGAAPDCPRTRDA